MSQPSVILLGSKPGATVALEQMLKRQWDVRAVVPSGEQIHSFVSGLRVEQLAKEHGIPVMKQDQLPEARADFVISYMFRHRVKARTLQLADRAALNFHAGPLPEYGGWAFYNLAILEEAKEYGCTCHHMDEGFDTGPLMKVRTFPIEAVKETAWSLEQRSQEEMTRLFLDFMDIAESGDTIPSIEQDKSKMRYLDKDSFMKLKQIPEDADEKTIDRYARAFFYPPYDGAYLLLGGKRIEVLPELAKQSIATVIHRQDLEDLRNVAKTYGQRKMK